MEILVVIPARSGSKGIVDKNIQNFCGHPLFTWTIKSALKSKSVSRVVLNTDSPKYKKIALEYGAEVPFLRPEELSRDDIHSVHVVIHTLNHLQESECYKPDLVVMLLPTSPLRKSETIDKAILEFVDSNVNSLISVVKSDKQLLHFRKINENNELEPLISSPNLNVQRQDLQSLYLLNGSIYISTPESLIQHSGYHIDGARAFEMDAKESIDINDQFDFELAEVIYRKYFE